jgi:drug/metabolite transporter (DMT)-like permease
MRLDSKTSQLAALLILSIIWGSSFILMKKGLESFNNIQVAALRIFFSFLFVLPFIIRNLKVLSGKNIPSLIIVGLLGFAIPALLFTKAQTRINSSLAGMLNSLTPLFTLIVGLVLYKSRTRWTSVAGVLIGLFGASGLVMQDGLNILRGINGHALLVALATLSYGININEIKYKLEDLSSIQITSLALLFVGPVAGIYLLFSDFGTSGFPKEALMGLGYIAILALFSSVMAVWLFNHLLKFTTTLFASSVTYIIPVFAILWGISDGESIRLIQLIWIAVILLGVYLVKKQENVEGLKR